MIFGILSALFLSVHSIFLGLETDINILKFLKRVVLLTFIIFELIAQGLLIRNFYKMKNQFKKFFYLKILKIKIFLIFFLMFVAFISVPLLIINGNVHFKHGLEWNFFIGVILYYLLTSLFWKKIS